MKVSAFLILIASCIAVASAQQNTSAPALPHACWKTSYGRTAGTVPDECPQGYERNGALCYPLCKDGFSGVGPVCWENCPEGYTNDGATCRIPLKVISANITNCRWYDECGLFHNCSTCPDGYHNDGCTCRIPLKIIGKDSYGRGAGIPMECNPNLDRNGALCYPQCKDGFYGVGPVCWQLCPTEYPVKCGWLCGGANFSCSTEVVTMINTVIGGIKACKTGPTDDCLNQISKLVTLFALDGLCPAPEPMMDAVTASKLHSEQHQYFKSLYLAAMNKH